MSIEIPRAPEIILASPENWDRVRSGSLPFQDTRSPFERLLEGDYQVITAPELVRDYFLNQALPIEEQTGAVIKTVGLIHNIMYMYRVDGEIILGPMEYPADFLASLKVIPINEGRIPTSEDAVVVLWCVSEAGTLSLQSTYTTRYGSKQAMLGHLRNNIQNPNSLASLLTEAIQEDGVEAPQRCDALISQTTHFGQPMPTEEVRFMGYHYHTSNGTKLGVNFPKDVRMALGLEQEPGYVVLAHNKMSSARSLNRALVMSLPSSFWEPVRGRIT